MSEITTIARSLLEQRGVDVGCTNALVEVLGQLPGRGVAEDEALCREGEAGTEMWVLVEGRIRVEKQDLTGVPRRLARIDAPAMLGHMALAGVWPRSASCIADVDSRVLSISRAHFDTLMDDLGPNGDIFRRVLIAGMSRQLGRGNAQLRAMLLPAFEDCDTEIMDRDMLNAQATFDGWVG